MAFIDFKMAYDNVPRELIWRTLIDKGTSKRYLMVIRDMYEEAKTGVQSTSDQLLTLSSSSWDELSREIQECIPWSMMIADDIVLVAESTEGLNNRLLTIGEKF